MKHTLVLTITLTVLGFAPLASQAELLVYEPFNYTLVNDEVQGRLEAKSGGFGFSEAWVDSTDAGGYAFVYDSQGNPASLYDGTYGAGQPNWDGVVNNLPTIGGYIGVSDWSNEASAQDKMNSSRTLTQSAGAMAGANGVLWMSMVVHYPNSSFNVRPAIALTDGGSFNDRGQALTSGYGIGVGAGQPQWPTYQLNATIWDIGDGTCVLRTGVTNIAGTTLDSIIIVKFEFGDIDTVYTWAFKENETLDETAFNDNAGSATSSIDEHSLTTLAIALARKENAIDEIRIGTTFNDVITMPPAGPVDIAASTVKASPTSASADGLSTSTITVTLRDAIGVPVPGKNVTLANTAGPQAAVITPPGAQTTDSNGQAMFTVSSSTAGTEVFTATDTTDALVITETAIVTFVSLADAALSTVVASPSAVVADGSLTSTITVTLKADGGFPVPGKSVTLANTAGPKAAVINPAGAQTSDSNGQVTFTVSSSTAGMEVFTATDTTDSLVITQTASVNFVDPSTPLAFNVSYWKNRPAPGSPEDPATLVGPHGGLGETWNQFNTTSATNLFSTDGVLTSVGFTITAPYSWDWGNPDLTMLRSGLAYFNKGDDTTFTIIGLRPGCYYNVWLASHANNVTVAERASGIWSTPNATSTKGARIIDSLFYLNGTTWLKGNNYVLFEYVVADTNGQIVFTGDATDAEELGVGQPAYRLPLNGWQLQATTPPVLALAPNAGNPSNIDFTWNSKADKVYDLVSATSLSTPISTWPVWNGQADLVATPPINALSNIPRGGDLRRFFALIEKNSPLLLKADFENDNGGFSPVGSPNDWAWGTPNSDNGRGLVLTAGNGGSTKCWGTNLGDGSTPSGLIDTAAYSMLRSPPIDLTGVTTAELTFAAAVDAASSDVIYIEIFEAGTDTWLGSLSPIAVPRSAGWASFGPMDLSVAAGTTAYLQFMFVGTDGALIGLYIDDVAVTGR